jgi:hypothetical protein
VQRQTVRLRLNRLTAQDISEVLHYHFCGVQQARSKTPEGVAVVPLGDLERQESRADGERWQLKRFKAVPQRTARVCLLYLYSGHGCMQQYSLGQRY